MKTTLYLPPQNLRLRNKAICKPQVAFPFSLKLMCSEPNIIIGEVLSIFFNYVLFQKHFVQTKHFSLCFLRLFVHTDENI